MDFHKNPKLVINVSQMNPAHESFPAELPKYKFHEKYISKEQSLYLLGEAIQ